MSYQLAQTAQGAIEYRMEGNGPVVLVLQGGHCSRYTRLSHEKLASAGFTVLTPSRPGYDSTDAAVGRTAQDAATALAGFLDALAIPAAHVIGISAAGPTALAFAQQYPARIRTLILESAVTLPWNNTMKRQARLLFGRSEKLTWALLKRMLYLFPDSTTKLMMSEFTTRQVGAVYARMSANDRRFVQDMIRSMRSGTGFLLDLEHSVGPLDGIQTPTLTLYSPYDKSVSPLHAQRMSREIPHAEICAVPADSHLIWIGAAAHTVWQKRLSFLQRYASAA